MTREEVAEMFCIVKKINDAEWLNKSAAKQAFVPKKPHVQSIADKLKLQLSRKDFKMVTERPEALRCKYYKIVKIIINSVFLFYFSFKQGAFRAQRHNESTEQIRVHSCHDR